MSIINKISSEKTYQLLGIFGFLGLIREDKHEMSAKLTERVDDVVTNFLNNNNKIYFDAIKEITDNLWQLAPDDRKLYIKKLVREIARVSSSVLDRHKNVIAQYQIGKINFRSTDLASQFILICYHYKYSLSRMLVVISADFEMDFEDLQNETSVVLLERMPLEDLAYFGHLQSEKVELLPGWEVNVLKRKMKTISPVADVAVLTEMNHPEEESEQDETTNGVAVLAVSAEGCEKSAIVNNEDELLDEKSMTHIIEDKEAAFFNEIKVKFDNHNKLLHLLKGKKIKGKVVYNGKASDLCTRFGVAYHIEHIINTESPSSLEKWLSDFFMYTKRGVCKDIVFGSQARYINLRRRGK